ncbi:hypothetical protein SARC_04035 [Sphaeroforma arctica JP610]|uniref:Uncharacterized protein n=1 Tax=Sphaeroforma arctica JP610 TaxID=667725 RepID=A0A0L0G3V9_9EUKA|nr:hypothetical protein SARC_04035 [Sphaeroforma arctica JP610]KNC83730.1 hypothetical protein SARC_04035 [Sphaeroforma arctica JP610]|eukprot:XP_014157632.1 hypothetical protein SARC_04035 [Sphaeroforma arctica JP610]
MNTQPNPERDLLSQDSSTKRTQNDLDIPETDEPITKTPRVDEESDTRMEAYVAALEKKSLARDAEREERMQAMINLRDHIIRDPNFED